MLAVIPAADRPVTADRRQRIAIRTASQSNGPGRQGLEVRGGRRF